MKYLIIVILTVTYALNYAQQSIGGSPPSFELQNLKQNIDTKIMRPVNIDSLKTADEMELLGSEIKPYRFGYAIDVNFGLRNSGTWDTLSNGDTLYSKSEINVISSSILSLLSSSYQGYDYTFNVFGNGNIYANSFGDFPVGEFNGITYNNAQNETFAQVGVWKGCGNTRGNSLRKPYVIFGGYNPKDGKSLEAMGNVAPWLAQILGAIGWMDGWRGPLYETYNGFFTDFSKNAGGGQAFGDNGARLIDKIRQEGYDVCIVRFKEGIGYLQTNAYLASLVLKEINYKIINEFDGIVDPGAALDPEAPGYPNSTKVKRAKHELVVGGYSAGALSGRLALTLMEYEHKMRNQCVFESARKSTHHRTKIWVGVDHETQGSNTPLGIQMFWDFQQSIWFLPANASDILNSLASNGALNLVNKNGVATQNTLYHLANTFYQGGNWASRPHQDFVKYFNDLTNVTLPSTPANLTGYPVFPYRISVSQGNANGISQTLSTETDILYNQSPSSWCVSPAGTLFGVGTWLLKATPFRQATARVLSSWNNDAFDCKLGTSFKTAIYSWHVNFGHWKYYGSNHVDDWWLGGAAKNYDEAAGSSLPSNLIFAKALFLSSDYPSAAFTSCNLKKYSNKHTGFAPTVSGLDLHVPGNNSLPRFPNLSIVPGNVSGGLNLMQRNKYNGVFDPSPNHDYGYPHLTFPSNNYDYTPYDAIWANTTNNNNYDPNTMHVEDPNPLIGEFLAEEIAPHTLYLSNRLIQDQLIYCSEVGTIRQKYYADFEARNSILAGDQSIYQHEPQPNTYKNQRTSPGDLVVGEGAVVTFHANNYDGYGKVTLGAGFSSKHGSIFRAYVYTDPNLCAPFSYGQKTASPIAAPPQMVKEARPIVSKRATALKTNAVFNEKINVGLYPNPTNGELIYLLNEEISYDYEIANSMGQILQSGKISNSVNKINIEYLPKGVYLVTIKNNSYIQVDRIILQ
ncbi:MAG: T9SS type A sorting domain-containing protein [Bacteroidetes bacterium]|nr:T9SS type A sorting domain-containing protein [Bacteroidota bacterium]